MEEATNELNRWQHVRAVATAFATLRQQADIWQEAELARALARLGHLDERDRELVRQFGCCLVEKMVDQAINWMCQLAEPGPPDAVRELLLQLFAVPSPSAKEISLAQSGTNGHAASMDALPVPSASIA